MKNNFNKFVPTFNCNLKMLSRILKAQLTNLFPVKIQIPIYLWMAKYEKDIVTNK